ncbi:uncharacterized protein YGR130C-like isoform X2 [Sesamum indicum]|uniref:Uncharacterized protein YGR130C-like isoform X2 n=1 Tax=Sesamum indicum TaxID=4182 RepID=A0A6I9TPG9_SESIN|nr:uncharacterized protein YGR130C-like isoform X2 [Sesamum indicum]
MPSGSKKRKAAKKKKENQPNNHPNNPSPASAHSHDLKNQDDKESDVGEVSSPASQDHHSHQNFSREGEEEEIEGGENISNVPSAERVKIEVVGDPNIVVEESIIPVEREFKIEDESDIKDGKHDDSTKESNKGGSSGSSSSSSGSSSDDESHDIKSSQAVADVASVVDSGKAADCLSGAQAEAIHTANIEEAEDPIIENIPAFVPEKTADDPADPSLVESVFKENGVKKLKSFEDKVGSSAVSDVTVSQQKEEEASSPPVEDKIKIPDQKEYVEQETDDRLTLSYNAPIATADSGAERENDSGVTEPLLAPATRPVQTTSWKSCCGLFEVFTGSGR